MANLENEILSYVDKKYMPMIFEECRLKSFDNNWPFKNGNLKPSKMARAGFFFCGSKEEPDAVKCFVCLKSLDGWDEDDDAFSEHQKHSSGCKFLKLNKPEAEFTASDFLELKLEQSINVTKEIWNQWEVLLKEEYKKFKNIAMSGKENAKPK